MHPTILCHRLLQHFWMAESDGDQHASGTGGFALVLFPTAEGAQTDSKQCSEGLLGQIEGMANLGDFALGGPRLGGTGALELRVYRDASERPIGTLGDAKHPGGWPLAAFECFFLCLETGGTGGSRLGGGGDRFHGVFALSCCKRALLRLVDSFLAYMSSTRMRSPSMTQK